MGIFLRRLDSMVVSGPEDSSRPASRIPSRTDGPSMRSLPSETIGASGGAEGGGNGGGDGESSIVASGSRPVS